MIRRESLHLVVPRCLVPLFDRAFLSKGRKEALWAGSTPGAHKGDAWTAVSEFQFNNILQSKFS